jgi:hypothetical protein
MEVGVIWKEKVTEREQEIEGDCKIGEMIDRKLK